MKKNDIVSGTVLRTDFPDKGYVQIKDEDGVHMMTVKGVLPGQEILARVIRKRTTADTHQVRLEGRPVSVVKQAPDSVLSPCPHFGECGGCAYLTMSYAQSAKLKENQVRRLLSPVFQTQERAPLWEDILVSPEQFGYRNKMEFTFGDSDKGGPLSLGMHKSGHFHDIVSVTSCQIVDADYRLILKTTLSFFSSLYENGDVSFYNRMQKKGFLRHLLVRKGIHAGEILVDLITTSQPSGVNLSAYAETILNIQDKLSARIAGILHTTNDSPADAIIDQGTEILYGQASFEETILGLSFTVTPFSFFQTNSGGAEVLYAKVRDYCNLALQGRTDSTIYDLYCGTGTITQLVSPFANRVTGVEIVPEAVRAAQMNAAKNQIQNVRFLCGDVLREIENLTETPDLLILDPPRDGIHPKALPGIVSFGARHIIYISCKPTGLVRDLPYILAHDYTCTHISLVDQFPWTRHIETIIKLDKK